MGTIRCDDRRVLDHVPRSADGAPERRGGDPDIGPTPAFDGGTLVDQPAQHPARIGVMCVDDNRHLADALRLALDRDASFEWKGWLPVADALAAEVAARKPTVVLIDVDMPGVDPFAAAAEATRGVPETRMVVFSGHVRRDLIDRAVDAGAWGYVSKNDGEAAILDVIRRVAAGEFALSAEARAVYGPM